MSLRRLAAVPLFLLGWAVGALALALMPFAHLIAFLLSLLTAGLCEATGRLLDTARRLWRT